MAKISNLFSESKIDGLTIANRLVVAPMTRVSASQEGVPSDIMQRHYQDYSEGGWGLILTEGTYIDEQFSQGYRNQPGIANKQHIQSWRKIVDAVHKTNTPIFLQLIQKKQLPVILNLETLLLKLMLGRLRNFITSFKCQINHTLCAMHYNLIKLKSFNRVEDLGCG